MSYKIYAYPGNVNSQKAQIAGLYGGINIEMSENFKIGVDNKTPEFLKWNPNGQVHTMVGPDGPVWESNAMARYVARKGSDKALLGSNDYEASCVDQWIEWTRSKLETVGWTLLAPILGYKEYDAKAHDQAKIDLIKALEIMNAGLEGKKFLVGNRITLADIINVVVLKAVFTLLIPLAELKHVSNVVGWFKNCVAEPHIKAVIGEIAYCEKEAAPGSLKRN